MVKCRSQEKNKIKKKKDSKMAFRAKNKKIKTHSADQLFVNINPFPAEPGYTLHLQKG